MIEHNLRICTFMSEIRNEKVAKLLYHSLILNRLSIERCGGTCTHTFIDIRNFTGKSIKEKKVSLDQMVKITCAPIISRV